jgi:hypothetical protein
MKNLIYPNVRVENHGNRIKNSYATPNKKTSFPPHSQNKTTSVAGIAPHRKTSLPHFHLQQ